MHIFTYTCRIHIDAIIKTSEDFFKKKYPSHFIVRFACERELETEQNCNILTPTLMVISVVSFLFSRAAQPEARGSSLLGAGFLYRILSPTGLQTNWLPVFTELYNSSIAHSVSLEWHVWSSSSGNNCHAVHRSLSSGASLCDGTVRFFTLSHIVSQAVFYIRISVFIIAFLRYNMEWWHTDLRFI